MKKWIVGLAVVASLAIPSQALSRSVLLKGLNTDILTQDLYCQIRGDVLSIDLNSGADRIYERYDLSGGKGDLTSTRIQGKKDRGARRSAGSRGAISSRPKALSGTQIWGQVAPSPIRLAFYDEASGAVVALPQFLNELGQNAAGAYGAAFYPGILNYGTRVFTVGNRGIIFTSGQAENGKAYQRRTLSGYSLYFIKVDFESRTYAFELYSEIGNRHILPSANQKIGAHISQPDMAGRFFIVTSEDVAGSDTFRYTVAQYEIEESGVSFKGQQEFSGDLGHVQNDSLVWQGSDISLFRTYRGGSGDEVRSMFHALDWENGMLLGSIDSAKLGAERRGAIHSVEIDGTKKNVYITQRIVDIPGAPNGITSSMTSIRYDRQSNSFTTDLEMSSVRTCISGGIQYYLTENEGSVFLNDLTQDEYEIDETEYDVIEDVDYLRSSTFPICFDGKVEYHKTRSVSDDMQIPRGLLSFPRVCGVEEYRLQNSVGEGSVVNACDIFGWCHLVTIGVPVRVETLEGLTNGIWRSLR